MSTQTPNLDLEKPSGNERPLVSVINSNMDKIDAAIGDVDTTATGGDLQSQVTALQDSVSHLFKTTTLEFSNKTIAAGSALYADLGSITDSDGYVIIGFRAKLIGMSNYASLIPSNVQVNNSDAWSRIYNIGSSSSTGGFSVDVIRVKA